MNNDPPSLTPEEWEFLFNICQARASTEQREQNIYQRKLAEAPFTGNHSIVPPQSSNGQALSIAVRIGDYLRKIPR